MGIAARSAAPRSGLDAALPELGRMVRVDHGLESVTLIGRTIGVGTSLATRCVELLSGAKADDHEWFADTRQPSLVFFVRKARRDRTVLAPHGGLPRALPSVRV